MSRDELLDVAAGHEPAFDAWGAFLSELEAEGDALTEDEARALRSLVWPTRKVPSARSYWHALSMLRTTLRAA